MPAEKLQKVLANLGLASRRTIEKWIQEGRIYIDDRMAKLGDRVSLHNKIVLDGKEILRSALESKTEYRVLIYNKPSGEICTRFDPQGRQTVFEQLPMLLQQRWISIGRLDIQTSGLLIFTNSGELAHRLMHPSQEIEREYAVRILGFASEEVLKKLKEGVLLEDGKASFKKIEYVGGKGVNKWYNVVLAEGRNREVRRLWESQGYQVTRLIRVRFGPILLPKDLLQGHWRELEPASVKNLRKWVDL